MILDKYIGRYFFHMTDMENLESILQEGLLCTNEKDRREIKHHCIANQTIQNRRAEMDVPCGQGGKVHDYVPFYFCSRNPMLLSVIQSKNQDQTRIIYLCFKIEKLDSFHAVFTNASANTKVAPDFYDNTDELEKLDWDAILNKSWGCPDDDYRHRKMAEVLVWNRVDASEIDRIVVFNQKAKDRVECVLKSKTIQIPVQYEPLGNYYFHYTKLNVIGQENVSLVHGPRELKNCFDSLLAGIKEVRLSKSAYNFSTVADLLQVIEADFIALPELEGIYQLETSNPAHHENVDDHTLSVVKNMRQNYHFQQTDENTQNLMILAAYLHDIGKGPKKKWKNGKQPKYPDHPADAIPMLGRIFTEEIEHVSEDDIRRVCLMVVYHDLIGDICSKGRHEEQLQNVVHTEEDVDLLNAIFEADAMAINEEWVTDTGLKRWMLVKRVKRKLTQPS